jgi:hypothetical protein
VSDATKSEAFLRRQTLDCENPTTTYHPEAAAPKKTGEKIQPVPHAQKIA